MITNELYTEIRRTEQRRSLRSAVSAGMTDSVTAAGALMSRLERDSGRLVVDSSPEAAAVRIAAINAALGRGPAPVPASVQLREARARSGLSQAAAAQLMGISRSALAVAEQGRWIVSAGRLAELVAALA